jgi:hypothetical protein
MGISAKQLDAVDWIDERLGSFSLALREISLLDSPQLKHPSPASVESFLFRFCRRLKFLLFLSVSLAISALLKNFQCEALSQLHTHPSQNRSDSVSRAPLAANYFSEVALVDAQLEHGNLLAFNSADMNLIGVVHECFCDCLYQFFHGECMRACPSQ